MNKKKVLVTASVASMIDQFNRLNICLLQEMGYEVHVACNFVEGNTCDAQRIRKLQEYLRGYRLYSTSGTAREGLLPLVNVCMPTGRCGS